MSNILNFEMKQCFFLIFTAIILMLFFPVDGALDFYLIQPWLSPNGVFYLRDHWFLATLNHKYVKYILIAVYVSFLGLYLASFKYKSLLQNRYSYLYFLIMVIMSTSLIGILKSQSDHACPWDMLTIQGQTYTWNLNQNHGHCFPGGHASTGFALIAGYFIYRISNPKKAYFYLLSGLILGFAMGWAQMMRGAHFLSHNLWTLWFTWLMNVVVYGLSFNALETYVFDVKDIEP